MNLELRRLIALLRKSEKGLWKRVAYDLSRSARQRRRVSLSRLNVNAIEGETVVVPGTVLGSGIISKKIVVAAFRISESAKKRISEAGGSTMSIKDLISKNPEAKGVRLIG